MESIEVKGRPDSFSESQLSTPSIDQYTVGWICALQEEYEAACRMLDDEFEGPETSEVNDNNTYVFGCINGHNVVIGCLPSGRYGISSAASVAKDMVRSFPNLRFALMVGIGGGAPTRERDIRLGDVVVSIPQGTLGGIIQYDFGKRLPNGQFKQTGQLNSPPQVLLGVIPEMRRRHNDKRKPDRIAEHLRLMDDTPEFQRPSDDLLYRADFEHKGGGSCKECNIDALEMRPTRISNRQVTVHYGIIASANSVMKDAVERDRYANDPELKVLCFEMEAGGLMDNFPCLVIRGICDYSDSHKNDNWHNYAALAAAAYARELLYVLKPQRVSAAPWWAGRIEELLSSFQERVIETVSKTDEIVRHQQSQKDKDILNWLTTIDYGPQHSDFINKRQEGTGTWVLKENEFMTWLSQKSRTLLCTGIPGAGKTILAAVIIEHINKEYANDPKVGIAYIYCNFRRQHEQKSDDLLLNLLKQLSQEQSVLPECVKSLHGRHKSKRTRPSMKEVEEALISIISRNARTFIIVDALDECNPSDDGRQKFLSVIFNIQANTGMNILATSRIEDDITRMFAKALSLRVRASQEDIACYLDMQMSFVHSDVLDDDLRQTVKSEIVAAAEGMFLLAQLHMSTIIVQPTKGHIKEALQNVGQGLAGLDDTYKLAMERINDQGRERGELANRILAWIIHATRPLSISELQHALAVRLDTVKLDMDFIPSSQVLHSVCAGLVTIDKESDIVRLVHYTTQEYFERTWTSWFPEAHSNIANVCLTYLVFDAFKAGFCSSSRDFEARLQTNVLYHYAAQNWGIHARRGSAKMDLIMKLLESSEQLSAASQAMLAPKKYSFYLQGPTEVTGTHVIAYFGLDEVLETLLRNRASIAQMTIDSMDSDGQTPLSWAAQGGHEMIVNLLLHTDQVDVNSKDLSGQTPISWAAEEGHEAVVELLLQTGKVEFNSKDRIHGRSPLLWAVKNNHEAIAKLLLQMDHLEVDSKDNTYHSALSWAVQNGNEAVVKALLESNRVDVDSQDTNHRTPLSWAAGKGYEKIVNLLLQTNLVDINSRDNYGQTPLFKATTRRHEAVAELLLQNDKVDPNSKDNDDGWSPLLRAISDGSEGLVKLLLQNANVDVNSKGTDNRTPLLLAVEDGLEAIVELLLQKEQIDVNLEDAEYKQTPLSIAAAKGHEKIVELLLQSAQIDVNSKDKYGWSPLSRAAKIGHEGVIKLLFKNSQVDVNTKDYDNFRTPLSRAAGYGREAVVEILLQRADIDVNSRDRYGQTPLSWAAKNGHEAAVKLLTQSTEIDIDVKDSNGWTPLSWAAQEGQEEIVKLLLQTGRVHADSEDVNGRTPLSWAAEEGYEGVVTLLLETGQVDINAKDKDGRTPMSWATENGHDEIIKLL